MNTEIVRYLMLTDYDNRGTIIKQIGRKFFRYVNNDWVRTGIMLGYFYPDAPEFDCYEVVSEEAAYQALGIA
ncbi:MAG: hypothetical protein ACRDBO_14550 [Lachnospiraceae bacterium]